MRSRHKLYFRGGYWPSWGAAIKFKPYNKRIPVTDVTEQTRVWVDLNLLSVFVPLPFDVWRRRDQRAVGVAARAARMPNVDDPETTLPPGVVGTVGTRTHGGVMRTRVRTSRTESQVSEHSASSSCSGGGVSRL